MERVTISLESGLAEAFDSLCERLGYASRSEAMRDLIRARLAQETLASGASRYCVAQIGYVYNHHDRQLAERIAAIQHEQHDLTVSSMHLHMDHDHCMEVAFLRGPTQRVRQFADRLVAETGVRHGSISLVPVEVDGGQAHQHGGHGHPHPHPHPHPHAGAPPHEPAHADGEALPGGHLHLKPLN